MKKIFLLFAISLAMPSGGKSQTYNYALNSLNIPCLTQKGDASLGIGWSRGIAFQALELRGAYSPMPHLAIMANYFGAREKSVRQKLENGTDFYLWEAAVGAYEKMPRGSASLFAGFGSGSLFSNYGLDRTAAFDIQRFFLQPGLSYRSNHFQAGLALRLSRLFYSHGVISYAIEPADIQYIQNVEKNSPIFLPELGMQAGIRLKPVTINLSISSIFPSTSDWNFIRLNSSLSVMVDFGVGRKAKQ
ncbi:MAG: hypothetical protein H7246_00605 [Phycisphaerae bacterium]|nr:hypothetical protein [Saprospiraceae bacterium]